MSKMIENNDHKMEQAEEILIIGSIEYDKKESVFSQEFIEHHSSKSSSSSFSSNVEGKNDIKHSNRKKQDLFLRITFSTLSVIVLHSTTKYHWPKSTDGHTTSLKHSMMFVLSFVHQFHRSIMMVIVTGDF